jgi:peptidoglycan hydrolase-like protein with peptidoglycan-binding domain
MDTLKESAQSGWAQTWELIVGDFEEAKSFFTELSDIFGGILGESADRRNTFLGDALSSNWDKLISNINEAGIETSKFEESIRSVVGDDKLDGIIADFGSLEKAIREGGISSKILKKALAGIGLSKADGKIASFVDGLKEIDGILRRGNIGDDVKKLQTALDELGYDLGKFGVDGIIGPITEKAIKAFQEANGLLADGIAGPETIKALEKAGSKIDETAKDVDGLVDSCDDLIDVITQKSGRELILDSLMNVIKAIQRPLSAVGEALRNTFSISSDQLYSGLEKINEFTKSFVPKGVLDSKTWKDVIKNVDKLGIETTKFESKLKGVLEDHGVDVTKLIEKYGDLGAAFEDGAISFDNIKEALLSFKGITESLIEGGENVDKIRRTFEGLFAIIDIIGTVLAGPFKLAFNVANDVLRRMGLSILDVTARIGDSIVAFRDNVDKVVDSITTFIVDHVGKWVKEFKETETFKTIAGWFKDASEKISDALDNISERIREFDTSTLAQRLSSIANFFTNIAHAIRNSKLVSGIIDGVVTAFGKLKDFFGKFKLLFARLETDFTMSVLSVTARLFFMFAFRIGFGANGFAVRDFRLGELDVYAKARFYLFRQNFKLRFALTTD